MLNNFCANGGDGFSMLQSSTGKRLDTGLIDIDAFVELRRVTGHHPGRAGSAGIAVARTVDGRRERAVVGDIVIDAHRARSRAGHDRHQARKRIGRLRCAGRGVVHAGCAQSGKIGTVRCAVVDAGHAVRAVEVIDGVKPVHADQQDVADLAVLPV